MLWVVNLTTPCPNGHRARSGLFAAFSPRVGCVVSVYTLDPRSSPGTAGWVVCGGGLDVQAAVPKRCLALWAGRRQGWEEEAGGMQTSSPYVSVFGSGTLILNLSLVFQEGRL